MCASGNAIVVPENTGGQHRWEGRTRAHTYAHTHTRITTTQPYHSAAHTSVYYLMLLLEVVQSLNDLQA